MLVSTTSSQARRPDRVAVGGVCPFGAANQKSVEFPAYPSSCDCLTVARAWREPARSAALFGVIAPFYSIRCPHGQPKGMAALRSRRGESRHHFSFSGVHWAKWPNSSDRVAVADGSRGLQSTGLRDGICVASRHRNRRRCVWYGQDFCLLSHLRRVPASTGPVNPVSLRDTLGVNRYRGLKSTATVLDRYAVVLCVLPR
jgi:hypothetical protein